MFSRANKHIFVIAEFQKENYCKIPLKSANNWQILLSCKKREIRFKMIAEELESVDQKIKFSCHKI